MICSICPRNCNIDRNKKTGFCGVKDNIRLAKACLHFWEEPLISGDKGSGTIFFSGCNLKCVYCQNIKISRGLGKDVSIDRFIDIMKELEDKGAHNINLVTPSHYSAQIIKALNKYKPSIPVVYNTSSYEKVEMLKELEGLIDIYLPDLKYSDNNLAKKYSNCENYFEIATSAIKEMKRQQKEDVIKDNLMKKGVIIRHLVLPNAINNTLGVIEFLKENLDTNTYFSLMGQYTPIENNKISDLNRKIKPLEYKIAVQKLINYNFKNTFIQSLDCASENYIPDFNLEGV